MVGVIRAWGEAHVIAVTGHRLVKEDGSVVSAAPAAKLLAAADRLRALAASGVDLVAVVPFTPEVAAMDHAAFFDRVLAPALEVRSVHVGSDFRLGARGASTVGVIRAWGEARGIAVTGHRLVQEDGSVISATRIRRLIASGDVAAVPRLLGRHHFVRGTVVHGRGEGSKLGFPTANVERRGPMQMPRDGVYAGWALTAEGLACPAAVNVGLPPMFADDPNASTLEATLLGYDGDLYGRELAVSFTELLRLPVRFDTLDELVSAVEGNMDDVRRLYGDMPVRLPR